MRLALIPMSRFSLRRAQQVVTAHHYLRRPVDTRCSVEGYDIFYTNGRGLHEVGLLLFGRPEATRCADWYGSVDDARVGRCQVTRWQVLNLARVWIDPRFQPGGALHDKRLIPGFTDRKGAFRSTLASEILKLALHRIGFDYLTRRPPCFLDEPYEVRWLLSYCDNRLHRGTIYAAAGFERYRVNAQGIETWRIQLPPLTPAQHSRIHRASEKSERSRAYRASRAAREAQLSLPLSNGVFAVGEGAGGGVIS